MGEFAAKTKQAAGRTARKRKPRSLRSIAPTAIPTELRNALPPGGGHPLPDDVTAWLGAHLGVDFHNVRVHDDARAHAAAKAMGAKAYTLGTHVVFAEGRFDPRTREGQRLLAHEMTHVLQQSRGGPAPALRFDAPHEQAARDVARNALEGDSHGVSSQADGAVAAAGATGIGVARDEDDKKKPPQAPQPPKQITAPPPPKQLSGPVTVDQVMADPKASAQFHQVAAGTAGNVKDITNVQGAIFEEVMNKEIDRRISQHSGLQELLPDDVDASKLRFVPSSTDPNKLKPGEAMFVRGDRIKGMVDKKKVKLTDGMILIGGKNGVRVATVFEGKSGERRAPDLHRTDGSKETPSAADKAEKARERKETPKKTNMIDSEIGGQVRRTAERLSPSERLHSEGDKDSTILIDDKPVAVRASPRRTRYLGVVPKDVNIGASEKQLAEMGYNFKSMKLASTEGEIKVAASKVAEKAQAGKPWPLPPAKTPATPAPPKPGGGGKPAPAAKKPSAAKKPAPAKTPAAPKKPSPAKKASVAKKPAPASSPPKPAPTRRTPSAAKKAAPTPVAPKQAAPKKAQSPAKATTPVKSITATQAAPTRPSVRKKTAPKPTPAKPAPAKPLQKPVTANKPSPAAPKPGVAPTTAPPAAKPGTTSAAPAKPLGTATSAPMPAPTRIPVHNALPAKPSIANATGSPNPAVTPALAGTGKLSGSGTIRVSGGGGRLRGSGGGGMRGMAAAEGAAALVEAIAVPIINHYLQEHFADKFASEARALISKAIEDRRADFEKLIETRRTEIQAVQAEGRQASIRVYVDTHWVDTEVGRALYRDPIVEDYQLTFEDGPPPKRHSVRRRGGWFGDLFRDFVGVTLSYETFDIPLEGTDPDVSARRLSRKLIETKLRSPVGSPPAEFESLLVDALQGIGSFDALRDYAAEQRELAGMSSDAGAGPHVSAYWAKMEALIDGPLEDLVAAARAKNIPLDMFRAYAVMRRAEAGMSSDAGAGPAGAAHWSEVIRMIDGKKG